uniref:C2H2-type domain-containing protein n=1 Tax=Xiphophorus maculatus TaxID=8083 RepID=A0A3B5R850_XIPMA
EHQFRRKKPQHLKKKKQHENFIHFHCNEAAAESETAERGAAQFLFCRRCCVQFDDKDKLETHMKSHVKEKRYSCPDCGKMFINESYIQIHQRIHTGERPFLCSLCGRGFHTASSLKLHEMQHSGERPYACSICGKTFQINSYLNLGRPKQQNKWFPILCLRLNASSSVVALLFYFSAFYKLPNSISLDGKHQFPILNMKCW